MVKGKEILRWKGGEGRGRFVGNRRFARRETDTNAKRKHNRAKRDTSIQARVVYAKHCARRGARSEANQTINSNSVPNADPLNIDHLRTKRGFNRRVCQI